MPLEVEIKIAITDLAAIRTRIAVLGFRVHKRRALEINTIFDTPGFALRRNGKLIRIRTIGRRKILTYKAPGQPGKHKSREEIELSLSDAMAMREVFSRLGYGEVFRYEKYRAEFEKPDEKGIVTIDETPIGNFLELEGDPAWIDRTAALLGYCEADYITNSYGGLYLAHRKRNRRAPKDMVFPTLN